MKLTEVNAEMLLKMLKKIYRNKLLRLLTQLGPTQCSRFLPIAAMLVAIWEKKLHILFCCIIGNAYEIWCRKNNI